MWGEFRRTCSQATASCLHETVFKNWPQFFSVGFLNTTPLDGDLSGG